MNEQAVTVYWRPGCAFCSSLLRGLDRAGLAVDRVDIWQDDAAAAFVRHVAGGNETVPTVRVADIALVNPAVQDVLRAVADERPEDLPDGYGPPATGMVARVLTRLLGG